jgi:hypothetical protein
MAQAGKAHIDSGSVIQYPTPPDLFDEDARHRLAGLSALLDFVAHGADDIGGPPLWEALAYIALHFSNVMEEIEARADDRRGQAQGARRDTLDPSLR